MAAARTWWMMFVASFIWIALVSASFAQQGSAASQKALSIEFLHRYDEAERATHPDERIKEVMAALQLEAQIEPWPFADSREQIKGKLWVTLGNSFRDRGQGSRSKNLELSIHAYEFAATIFTFDAFPQRWAEVQYNRANSYRDRIEGSRAENLEVVIEGYQAALTFYTDKNFPLIWARTQHFLGDAYLNRIRGARADNL